MGKRRFNRSQKRESKNPTRLYIFTNGKTEKNYFESLINDKFKDDYDSEKCFKVEIIQEDQTDPEYFTKKVLQKAQEKRITVPIWVVFDNDDAPKGGFDNSINMINRKNNYHAAYSNECFEVWILLHLEKLGATTRKEYFKKMESFLCKKGVKINGREFSNYEKNGKGIDLYSHLKEQKLDAAIKNAKWLEEENKKYNTNKPASQIKPSTTVHHLVEELLKLAKENK